MLIGGLQKSSLIDYRGKIAAIVFLQGCNFSCPYCHNPELVIPMLSHPIDEKTVFDFLKTRVNKLDGVVVTGGEATIHKTLPDFIKKIKNLGFCVKLDTNGTNPGMLQKLIEEGLLDYIAMDVKTNFEDYRRVVRRDVNIQEIKKSAQIILNSNVDYEFRTTVVEGLLSVENFEKISLDFDAVRNNSKIKRYFLQNFQKSKHVDKAFENAKTFSDEDIKAALKFFENNVEYIEVR